MNAAYGPEQSVAVSSDANLRRRLQQQEREISRLRRDREQFAREIHDTVIQSIYATGLAIEGARSRIHINPERASEQLTEVLADLNSVMGTLRSLISRCDRSEEEAAGLAASLIRVAESIRRTGKASVILDIDTAASVRVTRSQSDHLTAIVREAISNALRHAHATVLQVSLVRRAGQMRFEIRSNGVVFDPVDLASSGRGLRNMHSRAAAINGQLHISSIPEGGAIVRVEFPEASGAG